MLEAVDARDGRARLRRARDVPGDEDDAATARDRDRRAGAGHASARRSQRTRASGTSRSRGRKKTASGPRTATSVSATPRSAIRTCWSMCADWRYSSAIVSSGETMPSEDRARCRRGRAMRVTRARGRAALRWSRTQPWGKKPTATACERARARSGDHAVQSSSGGVAASALIGRTVGGASRRSRRVRGQPGGAAQTPCSMVAGSGEGDRSASARPSAISVRAAATSPSRRGERRRPPADAPRAARRDPGRERLAQLAGHVPRVVVRGMAVAAKRDASTACGPSTRPCALDRGRDRLERRAASVPSTARRGSTSRPAIALGEVRVHHLARGRRRVRVLVVLEHEDGGHLPARPRG